MDSGKIRVSLTQDYEGSPCRQAGYEPDFNDLANVCDRECQVGSSVTR